MARCPVCSRSYDETRESCEHVLDGKYQIGEVLGSGGMAKVFRGVQLQLERPVAIKLVRGDFAGNPIQVQRFKREALTVARLKHPNIVTIYDFGIDEKIGVYIVMELLEGRTLRDELKARKRLDPTDAAAIAGRVCSALDVAHSAGVVHRDLKPDNIFLETTPTGPFPKVLDFGVAKLKELSGTESPALTVEGTVMGTPIYMSPEQCRGEEVDARADIYSLGCVLYELLGGRPPFHASTAVAVMNLHVTRAPEPLAEIVTDIPMDLASAVARSLAKRPRDRYQTATEFRQAIEHDYSGARTLVSANLTLQPAAIDTLTTVEPTLVDGTPPPNNLPQSVTSFVGRRHEVGEVLEILGGSRAVTLCGPGGIGKTRLSQRVASEALQRFPDGVWFVELASLTDPSLVPQAVAAVIGAREAPGSQISSTLVEVIGDRHVMLVLDNCEHVVGACAALVTSLLRSCEHVRVLASSREALNVAGETVYAVPPLGVIAGEQDAVQLLVDRVRARAPHFALSESSLQVAEAICQRLDGIPLAIELAAARARVLTLEQIHARLGDRFKLLVGGDRTATARQQTMRAAIDWSYELLTDDERTLLGRLSVFAGGWTLDAAEAIASADQEVDVLDGLTRLLDKSLLAMDASGDEARYRMLETIRQYSTEKLDASGEADAIRSAHRAWFLDLAERADAERTGKHIAEWLTRLETEHDNLRAALRAIVAAGDVEAQVRMCAALGWFWNIRGHWTEGRARLGDAIVAAGEEFPALRGKMLNLAGALASYQDDFEGAKRLYEECLAVRRAIGDRKGVANALHNFGILLRERGDLDRAAEFYDESFAIFEDLGDPRDIAISLNSIGSLHVSRGDYARAEPAIVESLRLFRSVDYSRGAAAALHNLGDLARRMGDPERAARHFEESISVARELKYRDLDATSTCELGWVALELDDPERARAYFDNAIGVVRELGQIVGVAYALEGLACVAAGSGDVSRALRIAGAVARMREEVGVVLAENHRALVARWLDEARRSPTAEAALEAGRRLEVDAAIALARL